MTWIDLKLQHPEFELPILVFGEGRVAIARLTQKNISKESVSLQFFEGDSGCETLWITPTHWIPLPEQPTENETTH